jgi:hypothetical protein
LPFTGVDGLPDEGQVWVNRGELVATVVAPVTTLVATDLLVNALRTGTQPSGLTLLELKSYPPLEALSALGAKRAAQKPTGA